MAARFYWVNRYDPFMVGNQTPGHNGKVATVRSQTDGNKGKPMAIRFRLATRAQVLAWKVLAEGFTTFLTTEIDSTCDWGYTVTFNVKNPIVFENEFGLQDIDIGDDDTFTAKPGFDLWRGMLNLIIVA